MSKYIILARSINIGGANVVKMAELREHLTKKGFEKVATYIQTGNFIVQSKLDKEEVSQQIKDILIEEFNVKLPQLVVLTKADYVAIMQNNPYDEKCFVYFRISPDPIDPPTQELNGDRYQAIGGALYFSLGPKNRFTNSKLIRIVESKVKKVFHTARNWNTCQKLLELLNKDD
ncbi:hypothetical protein CYY_009735 [Polysphondylium violaceum]|uniref:DUF1697 domain-containing protein n=1 Tax=Polysphondylium violaceum TaxID=133409 RepID=A0A8J4PL17_9MYCE|nr:hypothetical protein CYY_009735 [Polysphondylium violaceum]